ncbi:hypothetical protein SASPL_148461 [Salvia splendens]|uniref:No apical meristem-associated C-terminal domain-containing protein n=1 Tax=Salvia splendens TaxID=180675 RepID=A0A8X8Z3E2_SALSN|nr:hypothetical protein SASPL_148461 [Salvia splendens]
MGTCEKLYHESQAENPTEINKRNVDSMKSRWKRLNENASKWVAACREANARRRSGMSDQDVENEAHSIYQAEGGNKFQDLIDGSNSKRTKTSESGEYTIPSNPETPTSRHSTSSRPIGRDKAKRKGKSKVTQSDSTNAQVAEELHA